LIGPDGNGKEHAHSLFDASAARRSNSQARLSWTYMRCGKNTE
jgi:hypothetical protein